MGRGAAPGPGPTGIDGPVILARVPRPALVVLVIAAAFAGLALAAPQLAASMLAKEGPVEHASHVVLLVAVVLWILLAARTRGRARLFAAALATFLVFVLLEELDWGAVYGLRGPGEAIARSLGHRNLHNAASGSSYLLFAVPLAAYFGWPHGPLPPVRGERLAFLLLATLFLLGNLTAWERQAQELLEALVYALMLTIAARHLRARPA